MNFESLKKYAKKEGLPGYRVSQMRQAVFSAAVSSWLDVSSLPEDMRLKLEEEQPILSFSAESVLRSRSGNCFKALVKLRDGLKVETVLLSPMKNRWTVCVSTQVGCEVGCAICATGKMRFRRNLSAEEITDQPLFWQQFLKKEGAGERVGAVVFMGMGEPLLNYAAVVKAAGDISDPQYLGIGQRHISISTCGHAGAIMALAADLPQANLALSLHSADEEERSRLVPMNKKYGLETLARALEKYISKTGRQVFIEYAVIPGVNNTPRHMRLLVKWITDIDKSYLICVNLIPHNPCGAGAPDEEAATRFAAALTGMGMQATVRKSLGADIKGACGQLFAEQGEKP
ncbi:MAG: 23S rRNA (adenine(2503)-C(2))-methyltransferase RlmN [Elusimicrobiales bacterium]